MIYFNTFEKHATENRKTSICPNNSHYPPPTASPGQNTETVCVCLADPAGILGAGCKPQKKTNKSPSQKAFLRYSGFLRQVKLFPTNLYTHETGQLASPQLM